MPTKIQGSWAAHLPAFATHPSSLATDASARTTWSRQVDVWRQLMNFDEYKSRYEAAYAELAETIKEILETAITGTSGVPRPQSIQFRAKSATSLEGKLQDRGLRDSNHI